VDLSRHEARTWIGAFAAVLGGLGTTVFAAGIGGNAPLILERICERLAFLDVELRDTRNDHNAPLISADAARVSVRIGRSNEELMIARSVNQSLTLGSLR
jgi:acetate kinase